MQALPIQDKSMREQLNSIKKQQRIIGAATKNTESMEDRVMQMVARRELKQKEQLQRHTMYHRQNILNPYYLQAMREMEGRPQMR